MGGPAAPKDPGKKRAGFYIMKEKEIFGSRKKDGKGMQCIPENNGRLVSSAKITGNISDEKILKSLEQTQSFRRLVHSIGVCVESEVPEETIEFTFQMYGRKDIYGGGTKISLSVKGDGMEQNAGLSDMVWSDDDSEPGQISFTFPTSGHRAKASVKLYVQEGFSVPQEQKEEEADLTGRDAENMISRSLLWKGNPAPMKKAIEKTKRGEDVTLAFIGGSITQGAGAVPVHTECYAWKTCCAFAKRFGTGNNVHYLKAGVGGTPSELGMIRFERDILRGNEKPDIVVIEFAVNDEGDETKGVCYESLVRKVLGLPWHPAVILLFSVFADDWNLQERLCPVGYYYNIPMVSVRDAVTGQFGLKKPEGRVVSKNQFFYDMYHPSNIGHSIMAGCLDYLFEETDKIEDESGHKEEQGINMQPLIGGDFENVRLLDRKETYPKAEIICGSFYHKDEDLQCVEMDTDIEGTPQFPNNWQYDGTQELKINTPFTLSINCSRLLLIFKDAGETETGRAEVYVDGKHVLTADPLKNGWIHCNTVILFSENRTRQHTVEIHPAIGDEKKKFTILGFGYVV